MLMRWAMFIGGFLLILTIFALLTRNAPKAVGAIGVIKKTLKWSALVVISAIIGYSLLISYRAFFDPVPPYLGVYNLSVEDDYATASGTLRFPENVGTGMPYHTIKLYCGLENRKCFEAKAIFENGFLSVWLFEYYIVDWSDDQIVALANDARCVNEGWFIYPKAKTVYYRKAAKQNADGSLFCPDYPIENAEARLIDGAEARRLEQIPEERRAR
ncbi:MAG: hypothetical protein LBQ52_01280 [Helicobacteraceae bacterium]|jgi:hypothetical protein|nr:hypothetical protein [Helicobacteraceae bacterium]